VEQAEVKANSDRMASADRNVTTLTVRIRERDGHLLNDKPVKKNKALIPFTKSAGRVYPGKTRL
jgi:hypothetical protein